MTEEVYNNHHRQSNEGTNDNPNIISITLNIPTHQNLQIIPISPHSHNQTPTPPSLIKIINNFHNHSYNHILFNLYYFPHSIISNTSLTKSSSITMPTLLAMLSIIPTTPNCVSFKNSF